ncbi:WYL domain-containing protein [Luteolibacter flavescens]|uniref:WYL domain-containing protein n=1 Tax=Luteolibacter flavescens TaxID=1859460 RepID=UPI003CCD9421
MPAQQRAEAFHPKVGMPFDPRTPAMHFPVSLSEIRHVIRRRKRVRFRYLRQEVTADFYILGQAWKTSAYVVHAWCVEPEEGWRLLRYAMIQNMESAGEMEGPRPDFDPYHRDIQIIDTLAYPGLPRRGA